MKKLYSQNALPAIIICIIMAGGCKPQDIPVIAKSLLSVSMQPLIKDTSRESIIFTAASGPRMPGTWRPNPSYHELRPKPKLTLLWRGLPFIHPRGILLDPDNDALWIADPGESEVNPMNKQARIIRVPLSGGLPGKPKLFYSKPGFLYSAEWVFPTKIGGQKVLVVTDQGKANSAGTFTGEGAKVFILPVLPDGSAGEPVVLWEQKPFKCPTGVAVVGDYIYITDPCAGPVRQDPMNPGYSFPTSAIFAIPLAAENIKMVAKAQPILLRQGAPFTSLSGICSVIPGELTISDTDSGVPDNGEPRKPGFSPPRTSDQWILKILDPKKPLLSEPVRTTFTERGDVTLTIDGLSDGINLGYIKSDDNVRVYGDNGTKIITDDGPTDVATFPVASFSNVYRPGYPSKKEVKLEDIIIDPGPGTRVEPPRFHCVLLPPYFFSLPKDIDRGMMLADNNYGGARERGLSSAVSGRTAGTGNRIYDRFTLDNAKGHGSVWIYPDGGGSPVAIAIGAPLLRPFAGQLSPNQEQLWFTDQENGSLYSVPFPSPAVFDSLYGVKKIIR
ncbi:SMP-30/gluconolactonase/LRE family protein [Chitinophaga ginsengisoli]|uniref:NHL repeat-containing protein n=1 Tax=Chitinophaga ginsengisoli TaxID=363837 RepID=A0A2P8G2D6_9BACT|nr:hypothetical protein [Chitinophaga ginsengisoli]PSL28142.1 hypothetical protein CLV42_10861 [Chitinophaga ginsengisoli]